MFEVWVTGHVDVSSVEPVQYIRIIKYFRYVTGLGLKDSKHAVEAMLGRGYDKNYDLIATEGKPYVIKCHTELKAQQVRIEFSHAGFTVEVHEVGQR